MRTSGRRRWRSFRDSKRREGESGRSHCPFLLEKTMNTNTGSWLSRNRWILMVIGVPVIAGTWWAFRPEEQALEQEIVRGGLDNVELGTLKGNQGDQNYDLPLNVDLNRYQAVAIYCERFHAIFGVARLEKF